MPETSLNKMEQESFSDYASKTYNVGSPAPAPAPIRSGFSFHPHPRSNSMSKIGNPPFSKDTKRKNEEGTKQSPESKTPRFDGKAMEEIGKKLLEQFMPQVGEMIRGAVSSMETKLDKMSGEFEQYRNEQGEMKVSLNNVVEEQGKMDDRIKKLELNPPSIDVDQVKKDVIDQTTQKLSKSVNAQWETFLSGEIRDKEKCLIMSGAPNMDKPTPDCFRKFCSDQLKMNKDDLCKIEIKQIRVQKGGVPKGRGQKEGDKNKDTVFVELGHVSQRNLCFKYVKNLDRKISLDKYVPKQYLSKYREYKETSWKLRMAHGVSTRIDFDGAEMVLRYKRKDGEGLTYSFVIHESYTPKPEQPKPKSAYTPATGSTPTPLLPPPGDELIVIMSGIQGVDKTRDKEIMEFFTEEDRKNIINISRPSNSVATIFLKQNAKKFVERYNGKDFKEKKISLCAM